jgi:DNA-binding CsgD family transcriptional regulator
VAAPPYDLAALTAQERACLALVAQRLSSKEIALRLGIAKTSVDTYCNRARHKLRVSDRYAAARLLMARSGTEAPAAMVTTARLRTSRPPLALVVGGLVAAALGLGALLAGMSALESLKPPGWDERVAKAAAAKALRATP